MTILSNLSVRERQIMHVLLSRGEATARDVQAEIPDAPTNAAVRRLLAILEEKGYVSHRTDGQQFIYTAIIDLAAERKTALLQIKSALFSGSARDAVAAMISDSADEFSEDDLEELQRMIDSARQEGR